ncbi:MAG: hypothetical protein JKY15_04410 [Deltaproteobacteria bacterium]|nr:hypothetical protein [Deltaproteobacteria bacterium]
MTATNIRLSGLLYLLLSVGISNAQEEFKGIPDDLNTSGIIFLKYEKVSIPLTSLKATKRE